MTDQSRNNISINYTLVTEFVKRFIKETPKLIWGFQSVRCGRTRTLGGTCKINYRSD